MVITYDNQFLLTVSEDGCMLMWKIIDKEGSGLKSNKEMVHIEEILITKSDLEEKVCLVYLGSSWQLIHLTQNQPRRVLNQCVCLITVSNLCRSRIKLCFCIFFISSHLIFDGLLMNMFRCVHGNCC